MKLVYKIALSAVALLVVIYHASFFILPSITIVNNSENSITQVAINLPSSRLDFGSIANGASNTLHYALTQKQDGVYRYKINIANAVEDNGSCGYVTNNEINKRVIITVHKDKSVTCH